MFQERKSNVRYRLVSLFIIELLNLIFIANYFIPDCFAFDYKIPIYNELLFDNLTLICDIYTVHLLIEIVWIQVAKDVFVAKEEMLIHHASIACGLIYYRNGYPIEKYGILLSLMILADICTYFLTLKRFLKEFSEFGSNVANFTFYISWFLVRVIGCPTVSWLVLVEYLKQKESYLLTAFLIHSYLTIMNYIATYKMIMKSYYGNSKSTH